MRRASFTSDEKAMRNGKTASVRAVGAHGQLRYDPALACFLEEIYTECNRPERLELDPLAVVKRYRAPADIEVAGLVSSTLAFGSVELIIRACEKALEPLGAHPSSALVAMSDRDIVRTWADFQYRFCFPRDMMGLMWAIRAALRAHGSLEALFLEGDALRFARATNLPDESLAAATPRESSELILTAASRFVRRVRIWSAEITPGGIRKNLLPDPADGSASKRLFLFLRWMARRDAIDPGCWRGLSPARLIVPMDTHMIRTCTERLGFLAAPSLGADPPQQGASRKSHASRSSAAPRAATLRDALRVTEAFRLYAPDDPVKYDFALTRPGIDPRPGDERFGCR